MIKLLHAADLHLDSPFSGLSPEQAAARRKEQRELPAKLAELCRIHGCDALLLAGDVFDGESVAPETVEALLAAFAACPCPVFLAPGNHDPLSAASPYRTERWPVNVHIFASRAISPVELPEQHCRVFGAGFESAYESGLLGGFSAPQDGWVNVMVLHGDALNPNSPYNAVTKEQIAASGLRYLALGHIHQSSGLLRAGHTAYAWPGCAMGRGFDELGEKGAYLVTLTDSDCSLEFLPLGGRSYEILPRPRRGRCCRCAGRCPPAGRRPRHLPRHPDRRSRAARSERALCPLRTARFQPHVPRRDHAEARPLGRGRGGYAARTRAREAPGGL